MQEVIFQPLHLMEFLVCYRNLKLFKACDPDQITIFLKQVAREIAPALLLLYNRQAELLDMEACICHRPMLYE